MVDVNVIEDLLEVNVNKNSVLDVEKMKNVIKVKVNVFVKVDLNWLKINVVKSVKIIAMIMEV